MKILIVQLARLGDIYMSWPAIRAVRRANPLAEIHLLTRPRFAAAAEGLTAVHKVIQLPTADILEPIAKEDMDVPASFEKLSTFVDVLHAEHYNWVINFSFSPLSSYLTHYVAHTDTRVCGYNRHSDGFLAIPDDISAYFYGQVGVGKPNRFHLIEIFGSMVQADLQPEDFRPPHPFPTTQKLLPKEYIVVHIGASEAAKSLSASKWVEILRAVRRENPIPLILVGAASEEDISLDITQVIGSEGVHNFVGKTTLTELFPIIKGARMLVGCDSAPMHMATLTNTPVVNISLATVNFWETGPRALESVVLRAKTEQDLDSERAARVILRNLMGEKQEIGVVHVVAGTPSYWTLNTKEADFEWFFILGLYMSEDFPSNDDPNFKEATTQLREINELMISQMEAVQKTGDIAKAAPFIERGEEIIETIAKLVPSMQILVRWYQVEKIRIAPGAMPAVLARTMEIHRLLQKVLDLYKADQAETMKELA